MVAPEPLEVDARRDIYELVKRKPGAHFSEIQRELEMATGRLQYHLGVLEKRRILDVKRDARYTRYFPSLDVDRRHKPVLALLRQATPRGVLLHLVEHGPSRLTTMSESLDLAPSTLSFHLKKLERAEVVEKRGRGVYAAVDTEAVVDMLVTYRSGFLDSAVDRVISLFTGVKVGPRGPDRDDQGDGGHPEAGSERT